MNIRTFKYLVNNVSVMFVLLPFTLTRLISATFKIVMLVILNLISLLNQADPTPDHPQGNILESPLSCCFYSLMEMLFYKSDKGHLKV